MLEVKSCYSYCYLKIIELLTLLDCLYLINLDEFRLTWGLLVSISTLFRATIGYSLVLVIPKGTDEETGEALKMKTVA